MIIELFIFLQILALVFLFLGFFKGNVLFYALALFLFGVQIFTSYNIEYIVTVVKSNGTIVSSMINYVSTTTSYINILFFAITLILLMYDFIMGNAEIKRDDD
jgi:hypothetical protein